MNKLSQKYLLRGYVKKISLIFLLTTGAMAFCGCGLGSKTAKTTSQDSVDAINTDSFDEDSKDPTGAKAKKASLTVDVMDSPTISIQNQQVASKDGDTYPETEETADAETEKKKSEDDSSLKSKQNNQNTQNKTETEEQISVAEINPTVNNSTDTIEANSDVMYSTDDNGQGTQNTEPELTFVFE